MMYILYTIKERLGTLSIVIVRAYLKHSNLRYIKGIFCIFLHL